MHSFFFVFNLISNFQKLKGSLIVSRFPKLCPYSSHSCFYHFSTGVAPAFIFVIFSVVKKFNDFSFFLDFHLFGLQLISFNIRQYGEFAGKSYPKF